MRFGERPNNMVGGSQAINSDELINEMSQNILDGKIYSRDQGNQRHSLVFGDHKGISTVDNQSQLN